MTHTLKFDPWTQEDQKSLLRFVLLYQAFLGTTDNPNRARSLEETRLAIKILDHLAEISTVVNAGMQNEGRMLKAEGGAVELDDAAFQLIKRSVDSFVAAAPFSLAKSAIDLKDFVDSATSK